MEKKDLKIVFLGTPDFAVESLRRIHEGGYNIVGVVTMPDKPAGRGHHLLQSPVKQYALGAGLPVLQPVNLKDPAFVGQLRSLGADLFVVIAFRMLPEVVWQMPRLGTFNLHASLLPRYRGAAPINRAVMNGDTETGVTTFFLRHDIDTGDVIDRCSIAIGPDEDVGSVHDRLMALGAELTVKTIDAIIDGTVTTVPQDVIAGGEAPTQAPKIFKEDCRIDWSLGAEAIRNHVRGLSPYPAAWTLLASDDNPAGVQIKVFATRRDSSLPVPSPGAVATDGRRLWAGTADGESLEILSLQPAGKRRMPVDEYLRGARLGQHPHFL